MHLPSFSLSLPFLRTITALLALNNCVLFKFDYFILLGLIIKQKGSQALSKLLFLPISLPLPLFRQYQYPLRCETYFISLLGWKRSILEAKRAIPHASARHVGAMGAHRKGVRTPHEHYYGKFLLLTIPLPLFPSCFLSPFPRVPILTCFTGTVHSACKEKWRFIDGVPWKRSKSKERNCSCKNSGLYLPFLSCPSTPSSSLLPCLLSDPLPSPRPLFPPY